MALSHNLTTSERVRTVYQEIWHEFYDWEQEHCRQTLASLGSSSSSSSVADAPPKLPTQPVSEDLCTPTDQSTSQEIDCYRVQYYFDSDASTTETLSCSSYSCTTLEPVKPYEACTYSHKNLYIAEDYCEKLPFMPFADDPSFRAVEFFELYDSMGWDARKDPDIDIIAAEAARRLHFSYGISFEEIDKTGILPMSIIESPERKGLLRMLNQRDMLSWPGSILSDLPPLPLTEGPLLTALRKRVNGIRYFFCANLNCVEPYCPTHLNLDEQLKTPSNILVNDETERAKDLPCGYDCYKYIRDHTEGLTYWDETTTDDFKFILEGAADLSSCDLAILCDKPCREVYAHRQRYVTKAPDTTALSDESSDSTSDSYERPIFADIIRSGKPSDHLPPSEICQHAGRCDALADCRCYRKQLHCHRNCSCELSCKRRPKGCRCKHSGRKMCRTVKCPCWKAGRECDPELCRKCDAKDASVSKCRNNSLQHGKTRALEVKQGEYGLGLFLLEPVKEGDLIGEYIGEILNDKMADARGVQTQHLGRNYLFGLNVEWTIDAALVGNETRFINHATGNAANCKADVREVNGDHRIGIYAIKKIEPGEEIFMDYGEEYFVGGVKGSTPRTGKRR